MYEPNERIKKIKSSDDKFKEFSYLIKSCKKCSGRGYEFSIVKDEKGLVIPNKSTVATECECLKKTYLYALYKEAHIPNEYWDLKLSSFFQKNKEHKEILEMMQKIHGDITSFCQSGLGMLFYGGPGTGKSLLGIETLKKSLRNNRTGYYEWFPTIIEAFRKKGFSSDPEKERYIKMFDTMDVLVIDEIGKERPDMNNFSKEDIKTFLEIDILKRRSNKTTILISNIESLEDFKNQYGVYVYSVITQNFKTINLIGTDFRNKGAVNQFFGSLEKEQSNG